MKARQREKIPGFDRDVIETWLTTVTELTPPIRWTRLEGGHSNLTYVLTDYRGREWVIRRPPLGDLLPKAHDMWREFRIIEGLWASEVPVVRPIVFRDDSEICDRPFYVMGMAAGRTLNCGSETDEWIPVERRRAASYAFVDVLATLHSINPVDVGLADLGRSDEYVARQLKRWYSGWQSSSVAAGYDDPRIHELFTLLTDVIPEQGPASIVHGDYGPHNTMFSRAGDITAVLDWELSTLGDPLADFAYSINAWFESEEEGLSPSDPATALPGFSRRVELVDRYARSSGRDVGELDYYRSFNYFKSSSIMLGVYARYAAGQKPSAGVNLSELRGRISGTVDAAWTFKPSRRVVRQNELSQRRDY
jgi:aminoglycoside phosphotransferase (APT) family kinase protein